MVFEEALRKQSFFSAYCSFQSRPTERNIDCSSKDIQQRL